LHPCARFAFLFLRSSSRRHLVSGVCSGFRLGADLSGELWRHRYCVLSGRDTSTGGIGLGRRCGLLGEAAFRQLCLFLVFVGDFASDFAMRHQARPICSSGPSVGGGKTEGRERGYFHPPPRGHRLMMARNGGEGDFAHLGLSVPVAPQSPLAFSGALCHPSGSCLSHSGSVSLPNSSLHSSPSCAVEEET
jgi:hypothetical protein